VFLKGTSDGQSRRDYKDDIFVVMGRVQGGGQSRETTTNRRTSFSSFDVFEGMGNQGETTNRMPLSLWDVFKETMHGAKDI
jgi:hypothetical protein